MQVNTSNNGADRGRRRRRRCRALTDEGCGHQLQDEADIAVGGGLGRRGDVAGARAVGVTPWERPARGGVSGDGGNEQDRRRSQERHPRPSPDASTAICRLAAGTCRTAGRAASAECALPIVRVCCTAMAFIISPGLQKGVKRVKISIVSVLFGGRGSGRRDQNAAAVAVLRTPRRRRRPSGRSGGQELAHVLGAGGVLLLRPVVGRPHGDPREQAQRLDVVGLV